MTNAANPTSKVLLVTEKDLPLHCPPPQQSLWNQHPKVFLELNTEGKAFCPYCGNQFILDGPRHSNRH